VHRRRGRLRAKFAISLVKDLRDFCGHLEGRLARSNRRI
jgi:hypothetical protein